jgi:hypothetical protein
MTGGLYKTMVVIWTRDDPVHQMELSALAREAETGDAYCSRYRAEWVADPTGDPAWDGTDFFDDPDQTGLGRPPADGALGTPADAPPGPPRSLAGSDEFVRAVAALAIDGELQGGKPFSQDPSAAAQTLRRLVSQARRLLPDGPPPEQPAHRFVVTVASDHPDTDAVVQAHALALMEELDYDGRTAGSVEVATAAGEPLCAWMHDTRRLHLTVEDLDDLRDGARINVPYADSDDEVWLGGGEDLTAQQLDQLAGGQQVLVRLAAGEVVLIGADPPATTPGADQDG